MKKVTLTLLLLIIPVVSYAAGITDLISASFNLVTQILTPLAFALCLLYFFWGVAKYVKASGDEKASEEGKRVMVWGIVALFVVTAIWGIINLIKSELTIPDAENPKIEQKK